MCAVFTSLGLAPSLMMLMALLATTTCDRVTTQHCPLVTHWHGRVRQYPEDHNATFMDYSGCTENNEIDILGLPNLQLIDLNRNALSQIDLAAFRHVPKLVFLALMDNKLRELPVFPKNSCPNLTDLDVRQNELTELVHPNTFSACAQLKTISLGTNRITYLHPDLFSSLAELKTLYLHNNKLTFIPDQLVMRNQKLRELWLNGNKLTHLPQDFASNIKNAGGDLHVFYFFDNPLRCACLLELLADAKRAGVWNFNSTPIVLDLYDGTHPRCVFIRAPCSRPFSGLLPAPRVTTGVVDRKLS